MPWLLGEAPLDVPRLLCHLPGQWRWCCCWRLSTFLAKMCKSAWSPWALTAQGWPDRRGPQQCTPVFKCQGRAALRQMGIAPVWFLPDQPCFTSPVLHTMQGVCLCDVGACFCSVVYSALQPVLQCLFLWMKASVRTCKFLQWLKKIRSEAADIF